jgi:hypothetical protein
MRGVVALLAVLFASLGASSIAQDAAAPVAEERPSALPWLKLEDLAATRERPLFREGRRPPYVPPPAPPAEPAPVAQVAPEPGTPIPTLKGIIRGGNATLVVLEDQMTSESVVVRSGENFGPWQVVAETDRSVRLATGDEQVVLNLYEGGGGDGLE